MICMMSLTNSTGQLLDFIPFHNDINLWTTTQKLACNNSYLAARDLTALRHLVTTRLRMRRSSLSGGTSILVPSSLALFSFLYRFISFYSLGAFLAYSYASA